MSLYLPNIISIVRALRRDAVYLLWLQTLIHISCESVQCFMNKTCYIWPVFEQHTTVCIFPFHGFVHKLVHTVTTNAFPWRNVDLWSYLKTNCYYQNETRYGRMYTDNHWNERRALSTTQISRFWLHIHFYDGTYLVNSSPPEQNGRHFADDIFQCIFMNEKKNILYLDSNFTEVCS